ncbi:uncharacterized protein LOC124418047 isoform X2 [Gallus gallus]|uniref:uncharacterized protein LOC124418047 isoform X2 n=1 Tax=Gallus gallus TaxID=9031 RepID=UPI001F0147AA|nr:uncharacterized protein LOC124418047 isoform X2 [Gallus gallus]
MRGGQGTAGPGLLTSMGLTGVEGRGCRQNVLINLLLLFPDLTWWPTQSTTLTKRSLRDKTRLTSEEQARNVSPERVGAGQSRASVSPCPLCSSEAVTVKGSGGRGRSIAQKLPPLQRD